MRKPIEIDGAWFKEQFERAGLSLREVASRLPARKKGKAMHPSALSRALSGTRKMSGSEARHIAQVLELSEEVVMQKAFGLTSINASGPGRIGFGEQEQVRLTARPGEKEKSGGDRKPPRHPVWGSLKGTTIIMPGVDLTAPTAPEWGQIDD